jgi:hypothetical protein
VEQAPNINPRAAFTNFSHVPDFVDYGAPPIHQRVLAAPLLVDTASLGARTGDVRVQKAPGALAPDSLMGSLAAKGATGVAHRGGAAGTTQPPYDPNNPYAYAADIGDYRAVVAQTAMGTTASSQAQGGLRQSLHPLASGSTPARSTVLRTVAVPPPPTADELARLNEAAMADASAMNFTTSAVAKGPPHAPTPQVPPVSMAMATAGVASSNTVASTPGVLAGVMPLAAMATAPAVSVGASAVTTTAMASTVLTSLPPVPTGAAGGMVSAQSGDVYAVGGQAVAPGCACPPTACTSPI